VVEHFKDDDAVPVYRRFREQGRMAPAGVNYISSWVTADLTRCFQIMEAPGRAMLDQWLARWADLGDFGVVSVGDGLTCVAPDDRSRDHDRPLVNARGTIDVIGVMASSLALSGLLSIEGLFYACCTFV